MPIGFKKRILVCAIVALVITVGLAAYGIIPKKGNKLALGHSSAAASQLKLPKYFDTAPPQILKKGTINERS